MKLYFNNKVFALMVFGSLVLASACKKIDYGNLNVDNNRTPEPVPSALLTNVIAGLGNRVWDAGGAGTVAGLYGQYFSETQYTDASRYSKPTFNWDGFYAGSLYDLQNIINYNTAPETAVKAQAYGSNKNQIAIARILKVYIFSWITDLWGDLPYSEALATKPNIPYDKQETVYPALLKELKEAIAQFETAGLPIKGDIMYGGNTAKWKKFANSIRMLLALNMAKANPALGKTEFAAALADAAGSISTNEDNAVIDYPGGSFQNPFYVYYNVTRRDDYAVSKTLLDWLNTHNDRRATAVGSSTTGFPYGLTRDNAVAFANSNTGYARLINPSLREEGDQLVVIGAANVLLARAEAAQRGWTTETVSTLYYDGIKASWEQWGVYDATAFTAYKANADVDISTGNELQKIATQEWLAWYPNGLQGWSVWRRTGFPVLTAAPGQPNIPRRMPYGPNEPQLNPVNYAPAAAGYNDNSMFARIWWDKQ